MKIIFMGTPEKSAVVLQALLDAGHEILAVVTQPDRPKGRGQKIAFSPVKELALAKYLPVQQPEKLKNNQVFFSFLKSLQPELMVVVAYGKILPEAMLSIPRYGSINLHASLLPKYRGAAPIQWALLNGEQATGVTIMRLNPRLDAGEIILQEKIVIEDKDNAESLAQKLFARGGELLLEALRQIEQGKAQYRMQNEAGVSYAPAISKESGEIDWRKTAVEINNRLRALLPWPMAHTFHREKTLKIWQAEISPLALELKPAQPGTITQLLKKVGFMVATGKGSLLIKVVQPEAKNRMGAYDYVLGHHLTVGEILPN